MSCLLSSYKIDNLCSSNESDDNHPQLYWSILQNSDWIIALYLLLAFWAGYEQQCHVKFYDFDDSIDVQVYIIR